MPQYYGSYPELHGQKTGSNKPARLFITTTRYPKYAVSLRCASLYATTIIVVITHINTTTIDISSMSGMSGMSGMSRYPDDDDGRVSPRTAPLSTRAARVVPILVPGEPPSSLSYGPLSSIYPQFAIDPSKGTAAAASSAGADLPGIRFLTSYLPGLADGLSPSPGVNSNSTQASQPSSLFYSGQLPGTWQGGASTQHSAYTYSNSNSATPTANSLGQSQYPSHRQQQPVFGNVSPSMPHFGGRSSTSPANGDNLPAPPSYQDHSPYHTHMGAGGGTLTSSLGSQAQGQQQHSQHHQQQHGGLAQPMIGSQNQIGSQQQGPGGHSAGGGPPPVHESPNYRPPPTPTSNYYTPPASTPQQSSFPSFQGAPPQQSPTTHSPTTSQGGHSRALGSIAASGMAPPIGYAPRTSHPLQPGVSSYPYHHMPGPVMSNMHQPGAPLAMVGPLHGMGYHHPGLGAHQAHHMYGHPTTQQQNERPFKCDQCVQSFNRNHDLKRHKRIHLAVKPFPCTVCDKSFSRKDALKVNIDRPFFFTIEQHKTPVGTRYSLG